MATAPANSDAPARQMSWAERARASVKPDLAKTTSPPPAAAANVAPTNSAPSPAKPFSNPIRPVPSDLPNGHTPSYHRRIGSDFATTAPGGPPPAEDTVSEAEPIAAPSPSRAPPINVWKERMAATALSKNVSPVPGPTKAQGPVPVADQKPSATPNGRTPVRGRSAIPTQPSPPALTDSTNWPSPVDAEKGKAAEEAAIKARAADTSPSATSSRSSGGQETGKAKKTKWVPIEADITIDAPLPTRYLKDGERSRAPARSRSRDPSRPSQDASQRLQNSQNLQTRPEQPPLSAGVPAFPAPAPAHAAPSPSTLVPLPTSLPAKPLGVSASVAPEGPFAMRAASPRMIHGRPPSSPTEALQSPSSPTASLSRSMSGSSAGRASSIAGSSSGRIEANGIDLNMFGQQNRAGAPPFTPSARGRGTGRPDMSRGSTSPRAGQNGFARGARGGFRGGRGGNFGGMSHYGMPPPMQYFDGNFMPYGYMPQMPYMAPQGPPVSQSGPTPMAGQQPFNVMPMMQALPPAPFKTDYVPPLDATRFYLLGQIEFYLTPDNLAKDLFLRQQMDTEGWIEMATVLTFKRIAALTNSLELMRDTLILSPLIEVDHERYKFRTKNEWARWIMPNARLAEPPTVGSNGASVSQTDLEDQDHDDGSKSAEHSASDDGDTTGTTGLTSPSLSSASQADDMPAKAEFAIPA